MFLKVTGTSRIDLVRDNIKGSSLSSNQIQAFFADLNDLEFIGWHDKLKECIKPIKDLEQPSMSNHKTAKIINSK